VVQAVRHVSFAAPDGRITGLLGPNGAGKTTTLRMISTLVEPTAGRALVDGFDCRHDPIAVRSRIGMLSEARGLYARPDRARERHLLRRAPRPRARGHRGIARAHVRVARHGALLDRRVDGFSTGERMKVSIARALVHDPPNVVLDEPTNGLDVMTTRSLREVIRRLRDAGKCVLFSSHVMQEVSALCDSIVIVRGAGAVVASGSAEELLAASGSTKSRDAFVHLTGEALEPAGGAAP
jgi:sodium transport system ATP-binding protein